MTRDELINKGQQAAYLDIADSVVSRTEDMLIQILDEYGFIDLPEDVLNCVDNEMSKLEKTQILREILVPVVERISMEVRDAILYKDF